MTRIAEVCDRLRANGGLPALLDAAYAAFELLLSATEEHEDPATGMFAQFVFAATQAANGRDAILFAPSLPIRPLFPADTTASGQESGTDVQDMVALSMVLCDALTQTADAVRGRDDRAACLHAARSAAAIHRLLTGDRSVTGRATFGDFLNLTRRDLDPANQPDGTAAGDNLEEVIRALARLVAVMRRYTRDLTAALPEIAPQAQPVFSPRAEACIRSDEALAAAARFLALRGPVLPQTVTAPPSPLTRRLERAAASLRMGRDLLHTHYSADYTSRWRPRSEWAHAITSEVVTGALLAELARFARQAADQCSAWLCHRQAKWQETGGSG